MSTENEKFFRKKEKSKRPLAKGENRSFSLRNIDCNGFVFHREDDSQWKRKRPETEVSGLSGGDKRDRTADLLNAIQALSQLSYTPRCLLPFCECLIIIAGNIGRVNRKRKVFSEKIKKANGTWKKAKTEAFHCGISTATDLFSTVKTIRSGKEKDLKPKFQVLWWR